MTLIIASLISCLAAFLGIWCLRTNDIKKIPYVAGLVPLVLILFGCVSVVPTGYVGIETVFGKVVGTKTEGVTAKNPLSSVEKISTKVQKKTVSGLEGSTKDLQMISNVTIDMNYSIDATKAEVLFSKVGMDYENVVISPTIAQSIKSQIAKYNAESLANARAEVALGMTDELNNYLSQYGICVLSVSLTNFDFSPEYNKAIEAKAVAAQETLAAEQRLEKAKIEAEQKKVEAQGQAEANKLLENTLTDLVIKEKFLNRWDGKLPTVMGSDSTIMDLVK